MKILICAFFVPGWKNAVKWDTVVFYSFYPTFVILRRETGLLGSLDCEFPGQKREVRICGVCECERKGELSRDWGADGDFWVCYITPSPPTPQIIIDTLDRNGCVEFPGG